MCLVVVAHAAAARHKFVMAANRDELHARPTRPAGWWPEPPASNERSANVSTPRSSIRITVEQRVPYTGPVMKCAPW